MSDLELKVALLDRFAVLTNRIKHIVYPRIIAFVVFQQFVVHNVGILPRMYISQIQI